MLSDSRGHFADIGLPLLRKRDDGSFGYMPVYSRLASDYLAAALPLGLQVRRCDELRRPPKVIDDGLASPAFDPTEAPDIWSLHPFAIEATNAAWSGRPAAIVWHFQRA